MAKDWPRRHGAAMNSTNASGSSTGPVRILGVCGSLRAGSVNAAILRGAARLASAITVQPARAVDFVLASALDQLPHFNADEDFPDTAPRSDNARESHPAIARWRGELALADAVLIVTPEYAHGYPGTLKNALDWIVGSGQLVEKPTALIVGSPGHLGGFRAQSTLLQVLLAMNVKVVATRNFAAIRSKLDPEGELFDEPTLAELQHVLASLAEAAAISRETIDSQSG